MTSSHIVPIFFKWDCWIQPVFTEHLLWALMGYFWVFIWISVSGNVCSLEFAISKWETWLESSLQKSMLTVRHGRSFSRGCDAGFPQRWNTSISLEYTEVLPSHSGTAHQKQDFKWVCDSTPKNVNWPDLYRCEPVDTHAIYITYLSHTHLLFPSIESYNYLLLLSFFSSCKVIST